MEEKRTEFQRPGQQHQAYQHTHNGNSGKEKRSLPHLVKNINQHIQEAQ